ncbi:hypothetical protein F5X96DRAFT_691570 [Biscogniauxia mediterranea]|nr:hypothetical protein F5X96DRAFT_691570 [Biscogniauxia mediterranea]
MTNGGLQTCKGSLQWLPQLRQALCVKHFIEIETRLYFTSEKHKHDEAESKLKEAALKLKTLNKDSSAPTRVQPSRRAREKAVIKIETQAIKRRNVAKTDPEIESDRNITALAQCREILLIDLPWEDFSARLLSWIRHLGQQLRDTRLDDKATFSDITHQNCPFAGELAPACRYCGWDPEFSARWEAGMPWKLAPPAPMYALELDSFAGEQIGTLGGITFAVDVCGETDSVVLLKLTGVTEVLEGLQTGPPGGVTKELTPDTENITPKPRKRGRPAGSVTTNSNDGKVAASRKKRRKVG